MECVLARGGNYNFTKKLAENIKQTTDANAEETEDANHVCKLNLSRRNKSKTKMV
jgi:hypothetical protein